ncbi:hypothetical protein LV82_01188 [Albidovulum inexpectatum]|uniref:Uncharacterized protein n=1 Tax=Albidovulum inexpectatum TaxID=196587 RepID=A0A2S5JHY2_9RHOB|nr:hypothetical protein [Albidovulum inexpectatum]PPB81146.1 hypothetical protein LV82_01188 [Albidovulum inexpectatum]
MKMIASLLRLGWRGMRAILRLLRNGAAMLVLVAMVALNVASLTLDPVNAAFSDIIHGATGLSTVQSRSRAQIAGLEAGLNAAQARVTALEDDLTRSRADLAAQRDLNRTLLRNMQILEGRIAELERSGHEVDFRGRKVPLKAAVTDVAQAVTARTARAASVNFSAMFAEAVPLYGVGAIVAATTVEMAAACATMQDMHDLEVALTGVQPRTDAMNRICGMRLPLSDETWRAGRANGGAIEDGTSTTSTEK